MSNVWEAMKKHQAEEAGRTAEDRETSSQGQSPPAPDDEAPVKIELAGEPDGTAAGETTQPQAPPTHTPPPDTTAAPTNGSDTNFSELIVAHHDRGGGITEEYRALRTNLLAKCPNGKFGYIITSAEIGEGKTVTSLNLAVVLAEHSERTTILVDGDLRKHRIAKMLGIPSEPGMVDLLRGEATLKDVVRPTSYPNLFFLPSGSADQKEIGEVLSRMERDEIFTALRRQYDYLIVDTPPINVAADAGMLGQSVGEALLVIRMGETSHETVEKAIRLLHAASVDLSGLVLTHRKYGRFKSNYLYRYS